MDSELLTKILRTQGPTVPKTSAARRKHPHFTNDELLTIASMAWTLGYKMVHFKAKAAILARGLLPNKRRRITSTVEHK